MKFVKTFEAFNYDSMQHIGHGTESEVYFDGDYAYRVTNASERDFKYIYDRIIAPNLGKTHKNVVKIYDAFYENGKMIVKMERLQKLDTSNVDQKEFARVVDEIHMAQDDITNLPPIIKETKDPIIKKMVQSIYDAGFQLGITTLDINIDNLMYDPKTDEYKQIDIF